MCRPYGHHSYGPHPMMGHCCGPWGWHRPSKEERLEWLKSYKENLEKELAEVEKEMERVKKEK
ncbi:MAG: DUF3450 domain-containing protein [candidate division KSB1 bacterium]|nr:DUF3450 domain-containing protein [candidate division KSB1 bacterium]